MGKARIPSWWLAVGSDTAKKLETLFHQVMADLPMSQRELAEQLDGQPDPSTVTRWGKGQTSPSPDTMREAVGKVRTYLEELLERASAAEEALQLVAAIEEKQEKEGRWAGREEVEAMEEILDNWNQ